jgi:UTP--glucose-1-phosphate uridylyltransferase
MINTVVIPAAGLGTRLFTITKEIPKEMVPVFYKTSNGKILLKPLLEIIFENLYDSGFRNFCFIVGRGKETIENHLSPHYDFLNLLNKKGESDYAKILSNLYKKIEKSSIVWIRQHSLKGIGPATALAKDYIGNKPFLFHAGDLYIPNTKYLKKMMDIHKKSNSVSTIGLKKVEDPRRYGVATLEKNGNELKITKVIEKPRNPPSNYALTGVNIFENEIFEAIKNTKSGVNGEIQLTDGIQTLIKNGKKVVGSIMNSKDPCIDIGVPNTYFDAIKYSYNNTIKK